MYVNVICVKHAFCDNVYKYSTILSVLYIIGWLDRETD